MLSKGIYNDLLSTCADIIITNLYTGYNSINSIFLYIEFIYTVHQNIYPFGKFSVLPAD